MRSCFAGSLPLYDGSSGQSMNPVRGLLIVFGSWLVFSSLAAADVLVDQSMMLGKSVEGNSQFPGVQNSNFAVRIDTGFVKLNLIEHIDLTEGGSFSSSLCFFSDMGKGEYRVIASSWHALQDGNMVFKSEGDDIPYTMSFSGRLFESGSDVFQSSSLSGVDLSCSTGSQASLTVSVDSAYLPDLWHGSYTDTITLLVHPE